MKNLGFKVKEFEFGINEKSYRLWYNLLILNLLLLVIRKLIELDCLIESHKSLGSEYCTLEPLNDQVLIFKELKHDLVHRLEPYLRLQIQKRGISITQNTYTGFDTEYELLNFQKSLNRLVSIQLAVQTRTLVKIPLYSCLDLSYVNPLSSDITSYYKPEYSMFDSDEDSGKLSELNILNESMKGCIDKIRRLCYQNSDEVNLVLIETFKNTPGVTYFEDSKRDQIVFSFPSSQMETKILYPENGYGFKDLIQVSESMIETEKRKDFCMLVTILVKMDKLKFDELKMFK